MSEYQFYEFQSVDCCLTNEEMSELRGFSSRADITPNSFTNEYSWGNFKGDEDQWMENYFDGFLYYANWGTHVLKLRLPSALLDLKTVEPYCNGDSCSARLSKDKIILDFLSESEDGGEWEDDLRLSSFLSLRSDLMRGDLRCLYLGWLSGLQSDEYDGEELEPPVPPGLQSLSPTLIHFANFLRIDPDLIDAAAQVSSSLEVLAPSSNAIRTWLANLPVNEKDNLLTGILEGGIKGDRIATLQLSKRFNQAWQSQPVSTKNTPKKRTITQLLMEAEYAGETRQRLETAKAATEQAERQRLQQIAREKRLNALVGHESMIWNQIEAFISEKKGPSYEKAVELLVDLRDLAVRENSRDFFLKIDDLKQRHSSKSSFIRRLQNIS